MRTGMAREGKEEKRTGGGKGKGEREKQGPGGMRGGETNRDQDQTRQIKERGTRAVFAPPCMCAHTCSGLASPMNLICSSTVDHTQTSENQ
jgi:hypothetical protein